MIKKRLLKNKNDISNAIKGRENYYLTAIIATTDFEEKNELKKALLEDESKFRVKNGSKTFSNKAEAQDYLITMRAYRSAIKSLDKISDEELYNLDEKIMIYIEGQANDLVTNAAETIDFKTKKDIANYLNKNEKKYMIEAESHHYMSEKEGRDAMILIMSHREALDILDAANLGELIDIKNDSQSENGIDK